MPVVLFANSRVTANPATANRWVMGDENKLLRKWLQNSIFPRIGQIGNRPNKLTGLAAAGSLVSLSIGDTITPAGKPPATVSDGSVLQP